MLTVVDWKGSGVSEMVEDVGLVMFGRSGDS